MKIPRNCFFAVFVVLLLSTAASAQSMRMVASGAPDDSTGKTRDLLRRRRRCDVGLRLHRSKWHHR